MEYRFVRPDGSTAWVFGQADAEKDPTGKVIGYVGTITDVTEQKQAAIKLRASLVEKELLLKEIHHRVKNNLQITAGLFSLQAGSVKEESVREAFRENENRIKSMALVHEKLYQSGNLGQVNIRDYIDSLATGVLRSYDDRSRRIKLNLDIPETHLPIDKALPFGLIVNELIANSIKHAFEPGKLGEINIVIRSADDFIVSVADNGKGLPPHLNVAETQSLGLKLVSMLTKQLHGSVTIGRGPGAEVLIRFPLGGN